TALTVYVISYAYSRVIEHFPHGGGGYLVATKLLGERAGLVSGCALLVDYILTIAISVATGVNALFALLPPVLASYRFEAQLVIVAGLIVLNLRGVKESVKVLTPIFLCFLVTHAVLILGTVGPHVSNIGGVAHDVRTGLAADAASKGGVLAL